MRLLTFLAGRFAWSPHSRTLEEAPDAVGGEATDAVVVFFHAERRDQEEEAARRVFKHTLKHVKWLANKRGFRHVVLHSFTHLGAETADAGWAQGFSADLAERLEATGYSVASTPFGWFCSWQLDVLGESLAKVWKEI